MTENQKMFLKIKGFKTRDVQFGKGLYGEKEWYLEKDQRGEIVITENGPIVLFHFYRECYANFLSLDSILNAVDYYKNKLDEIELEG